MKRVEPLWQHRIRTGLLAAGAGTAALAVGWLALRGPQLLPPPIFSGGTSLRGAWSGTHLLAGLALSGGGTGIALLAGLRPRMPARAVGIGLAAPLAGLALATAAATYPAAAQVDLAAAIAFVLALVAMAAACPGHRWKWLAGLLASVGLAETAVSMAQFARGRPTPVAWTGPAAARIPLRVYGTMHNPNTLGALLLLAAGGMAALALAAEHRTWRHAARIALVPLAAALALTFSRGAYIGLVVGASVTTIALPVAMRRRALAAAAALALGIGLATALAPAVAWRATRLTPATAGDWRSHIFQWRVAVAIWRSHPWLGAGPGGVAVLYGVHEPPGAGGTYALASTPGAVDADALQWLANTGLVGAALAAVGLALCATDLARALRRQRPGPRAAAAAFAGALAAIGIQGLFDATAVVLPVAGATAVAGAGLVAAAGVLRRPQQRFGRRLGAGILTLSLAAAVVLHAPWAGERALAAGWRALRVGRPTAYGLFQTAVRAAPQDAAAQAAAGDAAVRMRLAQGAGWDPAARADLSAALRLDPYDGGTWDLAGAFLTAVAHPAAAACAQQAAAAAAPYNPFFAGRLARTLAATGHRAAARRDAAYALRRLQPWLQVYREHPRTDAPFITVAQADGVRFRRQAAGAAAPARPLRPLPQAVCLAHLTRAGLPAAAYRQWAAAVRRP